MMETESRTWRATFCTNERRDIKNGFKTLIMIYAILFAIFFTLMIFKGFSWLLLILYIILPVLFITTCSFIYSKYKKRQQMQLNNKFRNNAVNDPNQRTVIIESPPNSGVFVVRSVAARPPDEDFGSIIHYERDGVHHSPNSLAINQRNNITTSDQRSGTNFTDSRMVDLGNGQSGFDQPLWYPLSEQLYARNRCNGNVNQAVFPDEMVHSIMCPIWEKGENDIDKLPPYEAPPSYSSVIVEKEKELHTGAESISSQESATSDKHLANSK